MYHTLDYQQFYAMAEFNCNGYPLKILNFEQAHYNRNWRSIYILSYLYVFMTISILNSSSHSILKRISYLLSGRCIISTVFSRVIFLFIIVYRRYIYQTNLIHPKTLIIQ